MRIEQSTDNSGYPFVKTENIAKKKKKGKKNISICIFAYKEVVRLLPVN